jgi:hypothetical protein
VPSTTAEEQQQHLRERLSSLAIAQQQHKDATPICLPNDPRVEVLGFDIENVKLAVSSTAPLIVPVICAENQYKGTYSMSSIVPQALAETRPICVTSTVPASTTKLELYKLLYKREDIRKDQVILNAIRLMDLILRKHGMDLNILTYRVVPTGADCGFVEMIQGAETFYNIQKTNPDNLLAYFSSLGDKAVDRFEETLAAWSIITLLLGIGDRHMNNIMARPDGTMFHIDYGYVLGHVWILS